MLMRSEYVAVRLTVKEKAVLSAIAKREERNLSDLFRLWLRTAGSQYGLMRPPLGWRLEAKD